MQKFGVELKTKLKKTNNGQLGKYKRDYMKIADLPLNKTVKFLILTIIIRNIFEKNGKYYLRFFLDDALYEV